ncbi:MAG: 3-deoxy-D-manno-octulosonic acid transferase [Thermoanaerobaculia bacterium]|nr:3-deoxy-D-manno-octulosonic acid transferase [Thermoanaerobaculia bacterium]
MPRPSPLTAPLWWLYQLVCAVLLFVVGPFFLLSRGRHYRQSVRGRLGFETPVGPVRTGGLWLHAVSVGEAGVAATLARALPRDEPALVTTITPTGQEQARKSFGGRCAVTYLPFEFGYAVRRLFHRHAPRALVLIEGDLWPLVLRRAGRLGVPVVVVNGRVSDRGFPRLRRVRWLARPLLLEPVRHFGVQTSLDRDRLVAVGVAPERITVTGNLKYETPEPTAAPELYAQLQALAAGRPILVAGSTMAGEETAVLDAFAALGPGRALLVLAPRHKDRWDAVATELRQRNLAFQRRSRFEGSGGTDVVLLDSYGELAGVYRLARGAFIGGTLVPTGGHNPLEPALFGIPVVVGPAMDNFREMAEEFDREQAWARVTGAAELAECFRGWLDDPAAAKLLGQRGRGLIERNRGALERTAELLARHLGAPA